MATESRSCDRRRDHIGVCGWGSAGQLLLRLLHGGLLPGQPADLGSDGRGAGDDEQLNEQIRPSPMTPSPPSRRTPTCIISMSTRRCTGASAGPRLRSRTRPCRRRRPTRTCRSWCSTVRWTSPRLPPTPPDRCPVPQRHVRRDRERGPRRSANGPSTVLAGLPDVHRDVGNRRYLLCVPGAAGPSGAGLRQGAEGCPRSRSRDRGCLDQGDWRIAWAATWTLGEALARQRSSGRGLRGGTYHASRPDPFEETRFVRSLRVSGTAT